ncbi:transmembrane protein, putative (macronuclear) [Tetrahymena thermophila SB210]|uniref:Transmembrane protein, putative n=1 Tax=Tetrahymena thermophila (strain SB210) TaxID=312017 RepID=I7M113_TETTS|nr:transmembrane protein, putative [Tetrahymena thermophila SB210]EAR93826.1 transmembrane protein, putative [Tetrahymena thermophila SB210]|eukprot:XP_001014071.1 transmembrane protein, putative [Tetrahymena thermophila SB210]
MKKRKFEVESSESDFSPKGEDESKKQQAFLKQFMKSMKDHGEKIIQDKPPSYTYELVLSCLYSLIWGGVFLFLSSISIPTCSVLSHTNQFIGFFHFAFATIIFIYMNIAWYASSHNKIEAWKPLQRFISGYRLIQIIAELILLTILSVNFYHFKNYCDNEFSLINLVYILLQGVLISFTVILILLYSLGIATDTIQQYLIKSYGVLSD